VGQTLSSVNPVISTILSRLLSKRLSALFSFLLSASLSWSGTKRATSFLPNAGEEQERANRGTHCSSAASREGGTSHRTVADHYEEGDRDTVNRESAEAYDHAARAYAASKHALEKSKHHKKHA
jgi:hypothetical protein